MPTRLDQLLEDFAAYHKERPQVWLVFARFSLEAAGRTRHSSADFVMGRVRWHAEIHHGQDGFKVNKNFVSLYARLFALSYPEHADFFRFRRLNSGDRDLDGQRSFGWRPDVDHFLRSLLGERRAA